eukprot:1719936-Alexandrium_andersonii.AAC.1
MSDIRQTEAPRHGMPTLWGDARRKAASAPPGPGAELRAPCMACVRACLTRSSRLSRRCSK